MRRIAVLGALCAGILGCVASAGATAEAPKPFLGLIQARNSGVTLARLDPLSLRPVSRQVVVGEYHDAWSSSPDGSRLALGVSAGQSVLRPARRLTGRIGIYIVDLPRLRLVQEIETGIAAEAVGWLAPRRLIAGLQRGGTVVVDPATGKILHRWRGFSFPKEAARVGRSLVLLYPDLPLTGAATSHPRLAVVDARATLRSVTLRRIRLAVRTRDGLFYYTDRAGLAVDPERRRAYVFAADAPVADVELDTLRVSYHRVTSLYARPGSRVWARERPALWVGDGRAVVFGRDYVTRGDKEASIPGGATLVDTHTWRSRALDPNATGAALAAGRLVVVGRGVRTFMIDGRRKASLLAGRRVSDVETARGFAYARTPLAVYAVDVIAGKVVRKIVPPPDLRGVIALRGR